MWTTGSSLVQTEHRSETAISSLAVRPCNAWSRPLSVPGSTSLASAQLLWAVRPNGVRQTHLTFKDSEFISSPSWLLKRAQVLTCLPFHNTAETAEFR